MIKRIQANKVNQEPLGEFEEDLVWSYTKSTESLRPQEPMDTTEEDPNARLKLSRMFFHQQHNPPQSGESWTRYLEDQSHILFIFQNDFDSYYKKKIDLSSSRCFDVLALDGLLFRTQVNASSKQLSNSESLSKDFRTQLILLKFICAHGPCITRNESDMKKACCLAQSEIFGLRRLLKQALKEYDGIYNLCHEISCYHSWCLRNEIIDGKTYEALKRFVEEESIVIQRQSKKSQINKIEEIYKRIHKKLDDLITQLNKKSFHYISMLCEDLYYLIFQTEEVPDHNEVLQLIEAICKSIEDLAESFYRNILEENYSTLEEREILSLTRIFELKLKIHDKETDFEELWQCVESMHNTFISQVKRVLSSKLPESRSVVGFLYNLFTHPYSFLMSKIFSHVNWPLLYTLLSLYESSRPSNGELMPIPDLGILTADLRLTFYSKESGGTIKTEIIPIHLTNTQDPDENKVHKFLISAMNTNNKEIYRDDWQRMEIELLKFLEANASKIITPKLKELRAKYNEKFEVGDFDIVIYSTTQYESPDDQDLLSQIYLKIEKFLTINFKIVNLRTKSVVRQYCFSYTQNKSMNVATQKKTRNTGTDKQTKMKKTCKNQLLVEDPIVKEALPINPQYPEVEPKTTEKEVPFGEVEDDGFVVVRSRKRYIIENQPQKENQSFPRQILNFSYEFLERIVLYRSFNLPTRTYFISDNAVNEDQERISMTYARAMKRTQKLLSESHSLRV